MQLQERAHGSAVSDWLCRRRRLHRPTTRYKERTCANPKPNHAQVQDSQSSKYIPLASFKALTRRSMSATASGLASSGRASSGREITPRDDSPRTELILSGDGRKSQTPPNRSQTHHGKLQASRSPLGVAPSLPYPPVHNVVAHT